MKDTRTEMVTGIGMVMIAVMIYAFFKEDGMAGSVFLISGVASVVDAIKRLVRFRKSKTYEVKKTVKKKERSISEIIDLKNPSIEDLYP